MDNKKDIARGIDSKSLIYKGRSALDVFLNKKTEKLAAAVFLVSDFMADQDPLRQAMRTAVLDLLSGTLSRGERADSGCLEAAARLRSLFQVASYAGLISDMNWQIFRAELDGLTAQIEAGAARSRDGVLSGVFFEAGLPDQHPEARHHGAPAAQNSFKGHQYGLKDNSDMSFKNAQQNLNPKKDPNQVPRSESSQGSIRPSRSDDVLEFFRKSKRSDVSIKDISAVVRGCSEKTIQRELISLVEKGLLRKEGERRWSRYFLVR